MVEQLVISYLDANKQKLKVQKCTCSYISISHVINHAVLKIDKQNRQTKQCLVSLMETSSVLRKLLSRGSVSEYFLHSPKFIHALINFQSLVKENKSHIVHSSVDLPNNCRGASGSHNVNQWSRDIRYDFFRICFNFDRN